MKIKAIYDNGGKTIDRYTIAFDEITGYIESDGITQPKYKCLTLSSDPDWPQGFSQWIECILGKHLGKKITFKELPENVQKHILPRG